MKVKIITDSTADLSPELVRQYDVDVVPLYVVMGDRISRDGTEATPEDIYSYVEGSSKLPKTSAPNLNDFLGAFQEVLNIYILPMSFKTVLVRIFCGIF